MKKYSIFIILLVLIIPSVASATWWNPFTWTKKSKIIETQALEGDVDVSENQTEIKPQIFEKVVERPIIKNETIVVQDPALQIKIDALIKENTELRIKVAALEAKNETLTEREKIISPTTFTTLVTSTKEELEHERTGQAPQIQVIDKASGNKGKSFTLMKLRFTPEYGDLKLSDIKYSIGFSGYTILRGPEVIKMGESKDVYIEVENYPQSGNYTYALTAVDIKTSNGNHYYYKGDPVVGSVVIY